MSNQNRLNAIAETITSLAMEQFHENKAIIDHTRQRKDSVEYHLTNGFIIDCATFTDFSEGMPVDVMTVVSLINDMGETLKEIKFSMNLFKGE